MVVKGDIEGNISWSADNYRPMGIPVFCAKYSILEGITKNFFEVVLFEFSAFKRI